MSRSADSLISLVGGLPMLTPSVSSEQRPDGSVILRSDHKLDAHEATVGEMLRTSVQERPDSVFLAERVEEAEGAWDELTYGEALQRSRSIGQGLLAMGLSADRPLMVLSGNGIHHGLIMLACLLTGIPIASISEAYSLRSRTFDRLRHIAGNLGAGAIYVRDAEPFRSAVEAAGLDHVPIITSKASNETKIPVATLIETEPTSRVEAAEASVGPDTVAKILYTSGSTGSPKGVINTHRMLCANQQALAQIWPFTRTTPPVLLDWLPWSHTFGGNHDFNLVLKHGGTMYIDHGRPTPGLIERTIANLAEVSPTISFNVPSGYGALLPFLETDPELAERYFSNLQLIFYAAASLPQDLWDRLQRLALANRGDTVAMSTGWGSTETAPAATNAHFPLEKADNIGVPLPGVELKLVPGTKTEVRVRGPNVTPGYWREPALTRAAFDEDGFYRIGDSVRLIDPGNPSRGLAFDGRLAEDFKLTTGTWVSVGRMRVEALQAADGLLQDAVVCGPNRDYVALLAWLNLSEAERLTGDSADVARLIRSDTVRETLRERISKRNGETSGSSRLIRRLLILEEPPNVDAGEITDKGYINQSEVLQRRAEHVGRLYADRPDPSIIEID